MTAPQKPWERAGINNQNSSTMMSESLTNGAFGPALGEPLGASVSASAGGPPPLPERPNLQQGPAGLSGGYGGYNSYGSSYGGYGGMGSMYGGGGMGSMYGGGMGSMYGGGMGYGGGMYGGGGYGGYGGGMNGGYNRLGQDGYTQNSFVQQADESSRQAFESIGSVVQVFGSISMMLESTFYAVQNSFRAVIGVADQFGRMKSHFAQIFSALAIFKTLRWLARKLLVLLRLRAAGLPEDAWSQAAEEGAKALLTEADVKGGASSSKWPMIMFFAVVFGGPWLIWRLLASIGGNKKASKWSDGSDAHFLAVAEHDFTGSGEEELSFRRGQKIIVAPKEQQPRMRGWLLASVDGNKVGIIPANYVKVMGKRKGRRNVSPPPPSNRSLPPPPPPSNSTGVLHNQEQNGLFADAFMDQNPLENVAVMDAAFQSPSSTSKSASEILDTAERDKFDTK